MARSTSVSTVGAYARGTQHYLALVCEAALMLALATGLGFGFAAAIERVIGPYPAPDTSVVATVRQSDALPPRASDFVYVGDTALGTQAEIAATITNNASRRSLQSTAVPDGSAPNELRLLGK
jgi:hypothetical protein